jgi:hypothetical protein
MDSHSNIAAHLRSDFAAEARTGFALLTKLPCTSIIRFLDYFDSLNLAARDSLLDVLARLGAMKFFPVAQIGKECERLRTSDPAYVQFWAAMQSERYSAGLRYQGMKMTKMILADAESRAEMAKYRATLNWQPRDDSPKSLVRDSNLAHVTSAKAPLLRKLVGAALKGLFATETKKLPGGETGYSGSMNNSSVTVWVDFGSMAAQLRYGVSVSNSPGKFSISRLSYEDLWVTNLGWDYLTEENAPSSIDILCERITYLVNLAERVAA